MFLPLNSPSLNTIFARIAIIATFFSIVIGQGEPTQVPLSFVSIKNSLSTNTVGLPTVNRILIKQVEERGLAFDIDSVGEKELREAGAGNDLITAIRESLCTKYSDLADGCDEKDLKCQIDHYTKALQFHPDDATVMFNRGIVRNQSQDYEGAISDYTGVLRIKPNDADAFGSRGNSYAKKGDDELALKDYDWAIVLAPKAAENYFNRAILFFDRKNYRGAVADYTSYIKLKPRQADAHNTVLRLLT